MTRADSELSSVRWDAGFLNNGFAFGAIYHGVIRMPKPISYGLSWAGTWVACRLMRSATAAIVDNLRAVLPDAADHELNRLALLTYRSYAFDTIDFMRSLRMSREDIARVVEFEGDPFAPLVSEGKGVILVGGHFGNWELGGVALSALRGYPVTVVGKPEPSPVVAAFRQRLRDGYGVESLEIGRALDTALQIRRRLADNRVVAMLLDRHIGRDRVEVTFFGRQASFARTPAMIGYLSDAPLLPSFVVRQPDGRLKGICGEPIRLDRSRPAEEAVALATQAFADELARQIRARPHLWYQFYRYWEQQPA